MGKSNKFSLATKSHSSTRVNPYDKITLNALNVTCPDKQIVLPRLRGDGIQIIFIELYSLFIFIIALATQYLNLYRSVWWLSRARSNQPINIHLIDLDVSQFSILFIGQSSLITILRALLNKRTTAISSYHPCNSSSSTTSSLNNHNSHNHNQHNHTNNNNNNISQSANQSLHNHNSSTTSLNGRLNNSNGINNDNSHNYNSGKTKQECLKNPQLGDRSNYYVTILTASVSWICNIFLSTFAYRIWHNFGISGLSWISGPIIFTIIMNYTHILQVLEGCLKTGRPNWSFLTLSITLFSSHIRFDDDKICHNCSNQPDEIREEVDKLRTIFNERLRYVFMKSILMAYYSSYVPLCFAQTFLYYDKTWTVQHIAMTWLCSLIMLISSVYTPYFYDVLHRSAFHFGKWQKLESRNTLVPCINWSENVIYPQGVVVKHYRGYFRSESVSNCAQPGVASHYHYYIVFSNSRVCYTAVLALLGLLLTGQMYLLLMSTEWYKLVAMANMMLINLHSIFRLVKSLIVITNIYKEKQ